MCPSRSALFYALSLKRAGREQNQFDVNDCLVFKSLKMSFFHKNNCCVP